MEDVKCFFCGHSDHIVVLNNNKDRKKNILKSYPYITGLTTFVSCKTCGFVYQSPRIDANVLSEVYREIYRTVPPQAHRPPDIEMQANWIFSMIPRWTSGKEILDIGCDTGSLLNIFKKMGWNTYGVEPTIAYAEHAQNKNGHKIEIGFYNDETFAGKRFDLITISHVIEHVQDPLSLLVSASRKLKEGGYIYVGTPNVTRPKVGFWSVFGYDHLYLFSPASITNILNMAGLGIVAMRELGARKGIDAIVQVAKQKKPEILKDDPIQIKRTITLFRFKLPFLEAKIKVRDFYKSFYKAHIRKLFNKIY